MKLKNIAKTLALGSSAVLVAPASQASTDYAPAIWKPLCVANYYTTGYGHKFFVVHDMEGYYAYTCSWFTGCNPPQSSVHFATNGKKDTTSDANPGEISQLGVRTAHYGWHATCWNQHSLGTEHEGFVSNPAWFTEEQYVTSASCTKAMCDQFGIPKDRNHIVGHNEKSSAAWRTYASANLGINPSCNTHTDPGPYWDWSHYMALVNGGVDNSAFVSQTVANDTTFAPNQAFSCSWTMRNSGTTTWIANGGAGYTLNYISGTQMGAPGVTGISANVAPNGTTAINIPMTAPATPGTYTINLQMNNTAGVYFGQVVSLRVIVSAGKSPVTLDNGSAVYTGTWSTGTSATDKYGADYRYKSTAAVSTPATWTANLNVTGTWNVRAWWPQGGNRSATAPYVVYHSAGSTTVSKNQQINGGSWQLLGSWNMNAGNNNVSLSVWTTTGFIVVADAVKWD